MYYIMPREAWGKSHRRVVFIGLWCFILKWGIIYYIQSNLPKRPPLMTDHLFCKATFRIMVCVNSYQIQPVMTGHLSWQATFSMLQGIATLPFDFNNPPLYSHLAKLCLLGAPIQTPFPQIMGDFEVIYILFLHLMFFNIIIINNMEAYTVLQQMAAKSTYIKTYI